MSATSMLPSKATTAKLHQANVLNVEEPSYGVLVNTAVSTAALTIPAVDLPPIDCPEKKRAVSSMSQP